MKIYPSSIHFSVDIIDNVFDKYSHHSYCRIGETLDALCEGTVKISDIPLMTVVEKDSKLFTGNNKRLWVFRQLERLGKCTKIPVIVKQDIPISIKTMGQTVTVRENPGGLWYLLPSSNMQDPLNNMILDTVNTIKEFMFPLPSPRILTTIFQNLNSSSKLEKRDDNAYADHNSQSKTISTGYIDVRPGEISIAQIDSVDREVWTKQWVMNHKLHEQVEQEEMEANNAVVYSEMVGVSNPGNQGPRTCTVYQALEGPDRLSSSADEKTDRSSNQSHITSGYLFVHGETVSHNGNITPFQYSKLDFIDDEIQHESEENDIIPADNTYNAIPKILSDVTGQITNEVERLLNGQHSVADQISEIQSYIGNVLENTFSKYEAKIQTHVFDIKALKDQSEQMLEAKQKEIEILKNKVEEIDSICQEEMRLIKTRYQVLSEVNASGTCVHPLNDPDNISHVAANSMTTDGREDQHSKTKENWIPAKGTDTKVNENQVNPPNVSELRAMGTNWIHNGEKVHDLEMLNTKLKIKNRKLKQKVRKLETAQNVHLQTVAESLFLDIRSKIH